MFVFGTGLYELFISNTDNSYGSNLFGLFKLPVSSYAHSSPCYSITVNFIFLVSLILYL